MQLTLTINVVVPILIITLLISWFSGWQLIRTSIIWFRTRDSVMLLIALFMAVTFIDEFWSLGIQFVDVFVGRDGYLEAMRWVRLLERVIALGLLWLMRSIYKDLQNGQGAQTD